MITKTKLVITAASVALMLMTGGAFAKTFEAVYTVSIHKQATKSSSIVDKLYEGERVKVQECDDTWCLINHDGPDGWVPVASLERVGGSYGDEGPTIIIQGGGFNFPHQPKPPIVVDPGPHKPKFPGQINVGDLPVSVFDPGTGGGNSGNGGGNVHPVHPVGPVVNPGGSSICDVKPQFCQPGGNNPGGLGGHGLGVVGGLHF